MFKLRHYPISLKLENKQVVIIGGGKIAERKLHKLIETGAEITIVSPEITDTINSLASAGKISWKEKQFSSDDILDAFLIVAATDSKEVNKAVYEASRSEQLINVVDNPSLCNYIVPSTIRRGSLEISVSTGGASPALAKKIINQLSTQFDESYEHYLDFLAEARIFIQSNIAEPSIRHDLHRKLLDPVYYELTRDKDFLKRQQRLEELVQTVSKNGK